VKCRQDGVSAADAARCGWELGRDTSGNKRIDHPGRNVVVIEAVIGHELPVGCHDRRKIFAQRRAQKLATERAVAIVDQAPWPERSVGRNPGSGESAGCLIKSTGKTHGLFIVIWVDRDELADLAQTATAVIELSQVS
jgi:hypothetical protein